jgi:hypothetical protein
MRLSLAIILGLLLSSVCFAQQGGPSMRRPGPDGMRRGSPDRAVDQKEINDWAKEYMPNVYKLITERGGPPWFGVARRRFNGLKTVENDPEALERMLKNIKIEDQGFGYIMELEKAKPEDAPALREKIRATFRAVFDDYLAQRAERLERAKQRLDEEADRLEQDRARADELVEQQLNRFGVESAPTTQESSEPARNTMASPQKQ